ncbi:MAG: hypothetical protein GY696_14265 [Gammaproteobacteria bacterium]|nr:hypothetical protein [Gammaproteobacteria bacterium]
MVGVQPEQIVGPKQMIGPGKDKVDNLGQDEEWARIPKLDFEKTIFTPQASKGGRALPPLSVNPVISLPVRSHRKAKEPANCNQDANTSFHEEMNS